MRSWLVVSWFAIAAVATGRAGADVPADSIKLTLKTPTAPEFADEDEDISKFGAPTDDVKARQFNTARCVCDEAGSTQNVLFNAAWATRPTPPSGQLFAWVGTGCQAAATVEARLMECSSLAGIEDPLAIDDGENKFERVGGLLTPGTNNAGCKEEVKAVTYGLYTSTGGVTLTKVVEMLINVDMNPPPVPTTVTVSAQEGQIALNWDTITSDAGDIQYFQALCSLRDGSEVHVDPTHDAQYDTANGLCGVNQALTIAALTIENDMEVIGDPIAPTDLSSGMAALDGSFICGEALGSTASRIELENLTNGNQYIVILVSVDKAGNPSAVYVPRTISPQPVTDFWEDVNEDEPGLEGGLCLVESAYGSGGTGIYGALRAWRDELQQSELGRWFVARYYAWGAPVAAASRASIIVRAAVAIVMLPLIAVALVWHALGLPLLLALLAALVWWRRRRHLDRHLGRSRLRLALAATLGLAPSLAAAQSVTPYWDDSLAVEADTDLRPRWHFGVRLGPFLPSIDDERLDSQPYQRMFGDGSWMPAIDLHRVFHTRAGQIGAGLSVGYFGKTADAWKPGSDTERAPGNETSLRIVPVELTAIYRASQLDDNWGIPLVPYARGGLGYSLWWVRRPDGELAKACPPDMTNCDRAIGGSLGLVGAAGLAIRAEGIDPDAARSMRDSGLDHAGFYAEVEVAWIDGFGSAKKLSLGDTTWFAGIDFEF